MPPRRSGFRPPGGRRRGIALALTRVTVPREEACARCFRPAEDCLCTRAVRLENRIFVLVLQHPREQRKLIGSASLAQCALARSRVRAGLSWPNLSAALGEPAKPAEWGALFLKPDPRPSGRAIDAYSRRGERQGDLPPLTGFVVLDGTWKQAKTLWWRNPWLLKLRRLTLNPRAPSLRPQARAAGLSTIEAIALTLRELGEDPALAEALMDQYVRLVLEPAQRYLGKGTRHAPDGGEHAG
ncbi:MAG TPA: tRNA-uridine aminocarboxypropyltransferase [Planctomycetota bacterium]|nr:MAG: DTW domain protein [Planctomycetes bacterium ADurb.Bin069]HNU26268.1 tRNA-uridine aminocarboxypropyltransferase [Planctomycetota bacterium]HOE31477.1 tRNA-uridine aminocarboxypropyltransferase [Planctomycetota bacterium]HOE87881.1 tRNA-uridine aminocarboxypropyltransferase [Planctomycetota bacterium]HOR68349.1 tRNA-uridine aminocarboxypropyltransferase [Planctomycetota bacterium]